MVADFFDMVGWEAYFCGANTPHAAVVQSGGRARGRRAGGLGDDGPSPARGAGTDRAGPRRSALRPAAHHGRRSPVHRRHGVCGEQSVLTAPRPTPMRRLRSPGSGWRSPRRRPDGFWLAGRGIALLCSANRDVLRCTNSGKTLRASQASAPAGRGGASAPNIWVACRPGAVAPRANRHRRIPGRT